jgi:SPP1 gp7 family putative phage head morphogenesis protein
MLTDRQVQAIARTLERMDDGLMQKAGGQLAAMLPEWEGLAGEITPGKGLQVPGLAGFQGLLERYLLELYVQGMGLALQEVESLAAARNEAASIQAPGPGEAAGMHKPWAGRVSSRYCGDLADSLQAILKESAAVGRSTKETAGALGEFIAHPGFFRRGLELFARRNGMASFNRGRLEAFCRNTHLIRAVQFVSCLDTIATDICSSRNGKILRLSDPALPGNVPPLHYGCRSFLAPVGTIELGEMEREDAFRWRNDWNGVPPPQDGFGGA